MTTERSPSRRSFLRGAAALAAIPVLGDLAACASRPAGPSATSPSVAPTPRPESKKPIAIDMHNHVYPAGTEPHPQRGPGPGPGGGGQGEQGGRPPPNDVGPSLALADEMKKSGFTAVCASFVLDFANNQKPGDARANFLRWLDAIDAELAKGDVHRALTVADLDGARDRAAPTIVQTVEGSHFIEGELGRIDEVYGRGLRHLQLLHEKDDLVQPLGDTNTAVAHLGGMTPFGVEVVRRCNQLGIVVDLAHGSEATVRAALAASKKPLVVSHTNLDTFAGGDARMAGMMKPRLIGRGLAKAVADAGGIVGVWTHLTSSIDDLVSSIQAMVDAIGVDHVGVGTDTDLLSPQVGHGTNRAYAGMTDGLFVALAAGLRKRGIGEDDIAKIGGGNYARVFAAATAGP